MGNRTGGHTVALTVAAGLTGAAVALLFAPRSGRETRAKLRDTAQDVKEKADHKLALAKDRLHEGMEQAHSLKQRIVHNPEQADQADHIKQAGVLARQPTGSTLSSWQEET